LLSVFRDEKTANPFVEDLRALGDDGSSQKAALPDHVYMDAMGFGMGCCCLQVTFQACNIKEARTLYDQLTPLCPILVSHSPFSFAPQISNPDKTNHPFLARLAEYLFLRRLYYRLFPASLTITLKYYFLK